MFRSSGHKRGVHLHHGGQRQHLRQRLNGRHRGDRGARLLRQRHSFRGLLSALREKNSAGKQLLHVHCT